jgi:predicted  nucleic acid-binding Zn-ribbon protein
MEYFVPIVTAASSLFILYTTFKLNKELRKERKLSPPKEVLGNRKYYLMRVKELEYRKEMVRNAILNVVKEFEAGNIDETTKDALLIKFREELDKIESELKSISKYAELEKLESEYEKLVSEFEKKKEQLERKIASLRESLEIKEETPEKAKEKVKKVKEEKEESLEDIMEEISKFMKEFGEE